MTTYNGQDVTSRRLTQVQTQEIDPEVKRTQARLAEIENELGQHIDTLFADLDEVRRELAQLRKLMAMPSENRYAPTRSREAIALNGGGLR